MIWFLEGQASQREIILGAIEALPASVQVLASHRRDRPEITRVAHLSFVEPQDRGERIDWVIRTALEHSIKVVVAGRVGGAYEAHRAKFEAAGITLVTGGVNTRTFDLVDDKALFTAEAERVGLPCIPAITVKTAEELRAAYDTFRPSGEVCIKPVVGIYGQGFWRFKEGVDPFRCFENPDARQVDFETYHRIFGAAPAREPMLIMPYLPGSECSVDMVCEAGKVVAFVGRRKADVHQTFERRSPATDLAIAAAEHFGCDGIVNVQTRDDASGNPHLLEINPRYSGGIGYTRETGVNLAGIFATRRLGFPEPATNWISGVRVKAITVAVPVPFS
ncbi:MULTISPECIES: ATP-grasp domain-containing protein [unclassified Pseudomonas]|uniref:ATP-grasp domain-containing protein n=1 Tax=Pseudomonas TaxID=286 RepID=UPI001294A842|nr:MULTISPECIES: ATP-grasp domain-containing protein [unclassified Pseudomonas]MQU09722.1 carboxylate--amine ligase [Pseudomonas sp. FSL R10-2189]MQU36168.1 carboxylate--amine ligase [Pseudomonas sp. FSL R10-2172]